MQASQEENRSKDILDKFLGPGYLFRVMAVVLIVWTAGILILFMWSVWQQVQQVRSVALAEARANINRDEAFRLWVSSHGGVYVPVDQLTPPNTLLTRIPERDLVTPGGTQLTLMNSAYVLRQFNQNYADLQTAAGHLTSLKPLRPENAPDDWEKAALRAFEQGKAEVFEFTEINGVASLRLMHPIFIEESCLKCHAQQGYQVGDIRGGTAVVLPVKKLWSATRSHIAGLGIGFGSLWLFGSLGILLCSRRFLKDAKERKQAEEDLLERGHQLDQIIQQMPFPVAINEADGTALAVNRAFLEMYSIPSADLVVGKSNIFTDPLALSSGLLEQVQPAYLGKTILLSEVEAQLPVIESGYPSTSDRAKYHDITVFPVLNEISEVCQVVTIWKDVTERRTAEREIERRMAEVEALHAVALAGTKSANLDELVDRVHSILIEHLYTQDVGIAFYDEAARTLIFHPTAKNCVKDMNTTISIDQGISGWVARNRTHLRVEDVQENPDYLETNPGTQSELCVPITIGDKLIGVINIESPYLSAFGRSDERLLGAVAGEMGTAVEKIRLLEAERDRRKELEILAEISAVVRVAETKESMLPEILERMMSILAAQGTAIAFRDIKDEALVFELGWGDWEAIQGIRMPRGTGIGTHVANTKEIYVSDDAPHDPRLFQKDFIGSMDCLLCLPLTVEEETVAVLYIGRGCAFQPSDLHLAQAMGDIIASAIHRVQLYRKTQQQLERLTALREIDLSILSSKKLEPTLQILLEKITRLMHVDAADIMLYDTRTQLLRLSADYGLPYTLPNKLCWQGSECLDEIVISKQEVTFIPDIHKVKEDLPEIIQKLLAPFTSYLAVPLVAKGEIKGVLHLVNCTQLEPSPDWMDFLQVLAGQAAIAIDNALLFDEQQQTNQRLIEAYDKTIDGWSRALDLRDKETEGHSRRVTILTLKLAERLGIPQEELPHLRRGAQLHDIGKMGIPDNILLKPGPLSSVEWEIMCKHPIYALDLLYSVEFLQPALEIPSCHHEKWDGSGYPQKLKGEEIPLSARIFAIVDVWDALTSDRPYRSAWSKAKALEYMREQSGKHFDPDILTEFLMMIDQDE